MTAINDSLAITASTRRPYVTIETIKHQQLELVIQDNGVVLITWSLISPGTFAINATEIHVCTMRTASPGGNVYFQEQQ
jgi:hypothetical protein